MKRLLTLVMAVIFAASASAQVDTTRELPKNSTRGFAFRNIQADSSLLAPVDTFKLKSTWRGIAFKGQVPFYWNGTKWNSLLGGGSSVWGGITGPLTDQTDLYDSLLARVDTVYSRADSLFYGKGGVEYFASLLGSGGSTDTTSLSNRINLKVNISDTAAMLTPYRHWTEGYLKSADIAGKLNISDTASMLSGYTPKSRTLTINGVSQDLSANRSWSVGTLTGSDTTSLSNRINLKLNISDTAAMLSPYVRSNIYTADGTLTGNRTVRGNSNTITFDSTGNFTVNAPGHDIGLYGSEATIQANDGFGEAYAYAYGGSVELFARNTGFTKISQVIIDKDSIRLSPQDSALNISNLRVTTDTSTFKPVVFGNGGQVRRLTSWPGGSSTNIYNSDGTLTGNRRVTTGGNKLDFYTNDSNYVAYNPSNQEFKGVLEDGVANTYLQMTPYNGLYFISGRTDYGFGDGGKLEVYPDGSGVTTNINSNIIGLVNGTGTINSTNQLYSLWFTENPYIGIALDSARGLMIGKATTINQYQTMRGLRILPNWQIYMDSLDAGGVAADSVLVIASDGQVKRRNASAFTGSTYTFQNGLRESGGDVRLGNSLIENTTIDGDGLYDLTLNPDTLFVTSPGTVSDTSTYKPLVTDANGAVQRLNRWPGGTGGSGVTTVGTFSGSSQTNGASISGSTITFGPADGSNPGMLSTTLHNELKSSMTTIQALGDSAVRFVKHNGNADTLVVRPASRDTVTLAQFGFGSGAAGDTAAATTDALYGSYFHNHDTLIITSVYAVIQAGATDTLGVQIYFNDSLNTGTTGVLSSTLALTSRPQGHSSTSMSNGTIPPGSWIWCKSPTIVAGRKPEYLSVSLIGYRKRRS